MDQNPNLVSLSPAEMAEKSVQVGINKVNNPIWKTFLLGFLGGAFIAFGAMFATVISTGLAATVPYGIIRLLAGLAFCLGLILVVIAGAEIFTGNILISMAWMDRKISILALLRNWGIVFIANILGSISVAIMVFLSGQYKFAQGGIGQVMVSITTAKLDHSLLNMFFLGILCNILVCLAIWLTFGAKTSADKVLVILFPITAFVAAGFEHSVADMYYLPMALFVKYLDPAFMQRYAINAANLTLGNSIILLLMVSLGNLVGGVLFVGLIYWLLYLKKAANNVSAK